MTRTQIPRTKKKELCNLACGSGRQGIPEAIWPAKLAKTVRALASICKVKRDEEGTQHHPQASTLEHEHAFRPTTHMHPQIN